MKKRNPIQGLMIIMPFLFFSLLPGLSTAQADCNNLINGGFEDWGVPAGSNAFFGSSNGWTSQLQGTIEVWGSGYLGVPAYEGIDFLELNSTGPDRLYQDIATSPGATYSWQVAYRRRGSTDNAVLEFGPPAGPFNAFQVMNQSGWYLHSGTYTVPAGQTTTRVRFRSVNIAIPCGIDCGNLIDGFQFQTDDCCPNDPNKTSLGQCGCGVADTDTDGDSTADCNDGCPGDAAKIAAGQCGCGFADTDSDGDATADCNDGCPDDVGKIAAGQCGCGFADTDSDGDATADCNDGCPDDVGKTAAGQCGCGVVDTDTDGDGTADCNDDCPSDPNKTNGGICGCGVADTDTDGDGTADCNDGCPGDAYKIAAGQCGCGIADTDTDGDGTADCNDGCPGDANKTAPGQCGCGNADIDTDGDGTADCNDGCPVDAGKTAPGQCGCEVADTDTDGDGIANCNDNCDNASNNGQEDGDCDGIGDACDVCPGGDDNGPCNATSLPSILPNSWICSNNINEKIKVCHEGNTICVSESAVATHLAHGDFLGPCVSCSESFAGQIGNIQYDAGQSLRSDLEIYPNPAGDELNIQLNIQGGAGTIITISDNFGRIIWTRQWEENRRYLSIDLSDNHFVNGVYYVVASSDKQVFVQRFVVSK